MNQVTNYSGIKKYINNFMSISAEENVYLNTQVKIMNFPLLIINLLITE